MSCGIYFLAISGDMDLSQGRYRVLNEPRGFIRALQWLLAIVAFSTCASYTGKLIVKKKQEKTRWSNRTGGRPIFSCFLGRAKNCVASPNYCLSFYTGGCVVK